MCPLDGNKIRDNASKHKAIIATSGLLKCEKQVQRRDAVPCLREVRDHRYAPRKTASYGKDSGVDDFLRSCSGASARLKWIRKA